MKNLKDFKNETLKKLDVFVGGELPGGGTTTLTKDSKTKETTSDKDSGNTCGCDSTDAATS